MTEENNLDTSVEDNYNANDGMLKITIYPNQVEGKDSTTFKGEGNIISEDEANEIYELSAFKRKYGTPQVDDFDPQFNKEEPLSEKISDIASATADATSSVGIDTSRAVLKGADKGAENTMMGMADLLGLPVDAMTDYVVNPIYKMLGFDEVKNPFMGSEFQQKGVKAYIDLVNSIVPAPIEKSLNEFANQPYDSPIYGTIMEEIAKFGITAIPAAKIVGLTQHPNKILRGVTWGGIADYMAINPEDPLIATTLMAYFEINKDEFEPWAKNAISLIEKHDTDGETTQRLKNMLEGGIIGGSVEFLIKGILKGAKMVPWQQLAKTVTPVAAAGAGVTFSNDAEANPLSAVLKGAAKKGIKFAPEVGENNLRLHLKRIAEMKEKNISYPGNPKNKRIVITNSDKTKPDIVVGNITFDDWKNRVEFLMNKDEIFEASKWYEEVFTEFRNVSGGNKNEMKKLGEAWLSAQQNETPSTALTNVLFIFEQFKRGVAIEDIKGKGLPSANKIATDIIFGKEVTSGAGQKISDFIDSGHGKIVRSIMNNKPEGGHPFVVDVHTGRDTGLVDQEFINHLKRLGYNVPKNLIIDHSGGGIKGTMYENRALFGQELTKHLNNINWLGKSNWTPTEIQAIGWMNLTKLTGQLGTSGNVKSAFSRNTRNISMEVDPGDGSPWSIKYGKDYNDLADSSKFEINNKVTAKAIDLVNKKEGLNLTTTVHGTGGWELFQNASTVSQAIASKESTIKAAARLGHMLNQTEVWVNTSKEITKGVKHFGVDLLEDGGSSSLRNSDTLKELFKAIIAKDTNGLFRGYQPIIVDGKPGIRIIIDSDAIKQSPLTKAQALEYIQKFVGANGGLNEILRNLNYDVKTAIHEVDLTKLRNDWKENPNGESYREHFGDKTRTTESSGGGSDLDIDGAELEEYFSNLIKEERAKKGKD